MDDQPIPPWDVGEVRRRVRTQLLALEDRRTPLVRKVHDLQRAEKRLTELVAQLGPAITTIEKAGGDAARIREQHDAAALELEPVKARLALLNKEWRVLNECCKWCDYADSGLHWLVFAECEMRRFDKASPSTDQGA